MNLKPFSENIIFLDTEFTDLNPEKGELLSIGMVKYTGEELYLELEYSGEVHPWVREKVLPHLKGIIKVSKDEAKKALNSFIGDSEPYLVAYVNQFDAIYWYKLFGSPKEHPAHWIPIDFAGILFGYGFDPASFNKDSFFKLLDVDRTKYGLHNALEDAKLLAEVYKRFFDFIK